MATFPTNLQSRITQNSTRTLNQRVIIASYGDGAEQAAAVGINSKFEEWTVVLEYLDSSLKTEFINFYNSVGLSVTWDWTNPSGTIGKWRITEAPTEENRGLYSTFTFKCKQVF